MLIDAKSQLCSKQAIGNTARTAFYPIGDVIDRGQQEVQGMRSMPPYLVIVVTTAFGGGASVTAELALIADDGISAADNIEVFSDVIMSFGTRLVSKYKKGQMLYLPMAQHSRINEETKRDRYLQLCVKKGTTTGGALSAFFTFEAVGGWEAFKDGEIGWSFASDP